MTVRKKVTRSKLPQWCGMHGGIEVHLVSKNAPSRLLPNGRLRCTHANIRLRRPLLRLSVQFVAVARSFFSVLFFGNSAKEGSRHRSVLQNPQYGKQKRWRYCTSSAFMLDGASSPSPANPTKVKPRDRIHLWKQNTVWNTVTDLIPRSPVSNVGRFLFLILFEHSTPFCRCGSTV